MYYSGKKKRHTIKSQIIVNKATKEIICTSHEKGRRHDFKLFKRSETRIHPDIKALVDTGYLGLQKIHANTEMPKKRSKKNPLTKQDKASNREISRERVSVENVIADLKKFKIISDKYRNRRKRFTLRFNLIAAIHNLEIKL